MRKCIIISYHDSFIRYAAHEIGCSKTGEAWEMGRGRSCSIVDLGKPIRLFGLELGETLPFVDGYTALPPLA